MKKLLLITLLFTSLPGYAVWKNAKSLLQDCVSESAINKVYCSGYISAVEDTLFDRFSLQAFYKDICIPAKTPLSLRVKTFIQYAKKHPENLNYTAPSILHVALTGAFPCKK